MARNRFSAASVITCSCRLILPDELQNRRGGHRSGFTRNFSSAQEKCERGNAANAKSLRETRQLLGVHLDHEPLFRSLSRNLRGLWCYHFARPTPCRPK